MRYAGPVTAGVVVAEIVAAAAVADALSWGLTALLLLALSLSGLALLRRELAAAVHAGRGRRRNRSPLDTADSVADAAAGVGGALLVAIPGFVTGVLGLVLVFVPPARRGVRRALGPRWARRLGPLVARTQPRRQPRRDRDHDVIEGEVATDRPPLVDLTKRPDPGAPPANDSL